MPPQRLAAGSGGPPATLPLPEHRSRIYNEGILLIFSRSALSVHEGIFKEMMEEIQRLLHEIEVRQSELEQENESLRATQRHLEAYRDRYVDLYDFAPLGYVTLDEDGYVQEINLAGAKLLDADREGLTGYAFSDHVAEESRETFQEHLTQCVRDRREMTSELHLQTRNGQSLTVQLRSIPIVGPLNDTLCKTAITDITERRKMEEEIRRSKEFLQTVIDAIPETMLVIGRDYRISLANRAAREMTGGIDPVLCSSCHRLSHNRPDPCTGKRDCCPLSQVVATKAPVTVMHTHCSAEGKKVYVEVSAAPIFDESGEVTHIIESCRDVTQRKLAEEALAQDRNLLRVLIDNLPDCIYVKDTHSRFLAANSATARLMGATDPNELLGKSDADFYPPEQAAEYRADEERLFQWRRPMVNKNESHSNADGDWRLVSTTKLPLIDSHGTVYGLVGISRDITAHDQTKAAMRVTQQAADYPLESP
jgi:PAS domain S-box-containing protein